MAFFSPHFTFPLCCVWCFDSSQKSTLPLASGDLTFVVLTSTSSAAPLRLLYSSPFSHTPLNTESSRLWLSSFAFLTLPTFSKLVSPLLLFSTCVMMQTYRLAQISLVFQTQISKCPWKSPDECFIGTPNVSCSKTSHLSLTSLAPYPVFLVSVMVWLSKQKFQCFS